MNNYKFFVCKLNPDPKLEIPDDPGQSGFDAWVKNIHAMFNRRVNAIKAAAKTHLKDEPIIDVSFGDWLLRRADRGLLFSIGDVVRHKGELGIVVDYQFTLVHVAREYSCYPVLERVVINTPSGLLVCDVDNLSRQSIPQEIMNLAKAQLLSQCPDVCPLRK